MKNILRLIATVSSILTVFSCNKEIDKPIVDELRIWRMAFNAAYGRQMSYGEIIRGMIDSLEDTEPGVVEILDIMVAKLPDLAEKLSKYRGFKDDAPIMN